MLLALAITSKAEVEEAPTGRQSAGCVEDWVEARMSASGNLDDEGMRTGSLGWAEPASAEVP